MENTFDKILAILDVPHTKNSGWYNKRKADIENLLKQNEGSWDDVFGIVWNREVSKGTKEALIMERYKKPVKK